jgi:hypothetical protein
MSHGTVKRLIWIVLLIVCTVAAIYLQQVLAPRMPRFTYLSGWVLFALMLVLTAYNGRKKVPFLPLISSQAWLQFHIYAGWFTGVLFLVHVSYRLPTGWFEGTLAALYWSVMLSGVIGLFLSRNTPKRLTTYGGEVLFERIPAIRHQFKMQAEALALKTVADARSPAIGEFYLEYLRDFFDGPRHVWSHMIGSQRPRSRLISKIDNLNRYLNPQERETLAKIAEITRQKDGLDHHYALQLLLRGWLFVHIPLTYSLLLFTFVHIVLVFAFSGGAR